MWDGTDEIRRAVRAALPNAQPIRRIRAALLAALAVILMAAGLWYWRELRPIAADQVTQVRGLVRVAAHRRAESTQAVYGRLHRALGVRRTAHIQRADYDRAIEMLVREGD